MRRRVAARARTSVPSPASACRGRTDYFDLHHTANDTLDKVKATDLDQQAAAYAILAYAAAQSPVDFGRAPIEATP